MEGVLCVLCSYGWHDTFIGCCHASLLGSVDILEQILHSSGWAADGFIIQLQRARQKQGQRHFGVADAPLNQINLEVIYLQKAAFSRQKEQPPTTCQLHATALSVESYYITTVCAGRGINRILLIPMSVSIPSVCPVTTGSVWKKKPVQVFSVNTVLLCLPLGWKAAAFMRRVLKPRHSWNFSSCCVERCLKFVACVSSLT